MNDRQQKIDSFLKFWKEVLVQNPDIELNNSSIIYNELIRIGVPESERKINVHDVGLFDYWVRYFSKANNINVFVSENWKYFCQFINKKDEVLNEKECIKMYIPLDAEHLAMGATNIFSFLEKNNIPHVSKIGKHIRFDNIVVRLKNEEDSSKLAEFIKNNKYIQEGLLPANPFAYSKDGIAYACDGRLSYNSTVASYIFMYLNNKRKYQRLEEINVFDFQNFIANYYNSKLMSNQVGDIEIFNDMDDRETRPNSERRENYKQVTELIVSSLKKEFSYDDYLQHFYKNKGELYNTQDENVYYDAITMYKYAIEQSCGKYGIEIGMSQIHSYIKTGKENYLTRNGNLRDIMIRADFREKILNLSAEMDYDMIVLQAKKQILDEAIVATHDKYKEYPTNSGNLFIVEGLNNYLKTGTPSNFTRDNNHRENLINCISTDELLKIVSSSLGIKISEQYLNSKEYVSMISSQYINSIYEEKNISAGQR